MFRSIDKCVHGSIDKRVHGEWIILYIIDWNRNGINVVMILFEEVPSRVVMFCQSETFSVRTTSSWVRSLGEIDAVLITYQHNTHTNIGLNRPFRKTFWWLMIFHTVTKLCSASRFEKLKPFPWSVAEPTFETTEYRRLMQKRREHSIPIPRVTKLVVCKCQCSENSSSQCNAHHERRALPWAFFHLGLVSSYHLMQCRPSQSARWK